MKKFLSFLTALVLSTGAFAQKINTTSLKANKFITTVPVQKEKTVSRKTLSENQYLCGFYTTDDLAEYGSGMGSYTSGVCKAATLFDESVLANFDGFKVVGIRIGLWANVANFSVYIGKVTTTYINDFFTKSIGTGQEGWNTIMFDESEQFTLNAAEMLMVGYEYMQKRGTTNDCYPISYYEDSEKKSELYFYGNIPAAYGGAGLGWYYLGADGALSVQLIVEGELPEQKVSASSISIDQYVKAGNTATASLKVTNLGKETVNSVGFSYYIDDTKMGDEVVSTTITFGKTVAMPFNVSVPADFAEGTHTLKAEITTINNAAPAEVESGMTQTVFSVYTNTVARQKYLVEHITSWTCTWCYLGYSLLRNMESSYDDVAWVALHGNQNINSKDPYYFTEVDYVMDFLGAGGFPSAAFDRTYLPDLADGNELAYSIGYYEQYSAQMAAAIHGLLEENAVPSFVTIGIDTEFDADTRQLQVTVNGTGVEQAAQLLTGQRLTVYLTEVGLTGRQYSNGKWDNNFDHNNTLRAILTSYTGDAITWDGDNFTVTKTYTVPADYVADNLSVVAFVAPQPSSNTKAMAVNNCEKVAVKSSETGINPIVGTTTGVAKDYFTIDGRQVSAPQKGMNIIRMSDGTTRKVMIK